MSTNRGNWVEIGVEEGRAGRETETSEIGNEENRIGRETSQRRWKKNED